MLTKKEIMKVISDRGYFVDDSQKYEDRFFFQESEDNDSFSYAFGIDKEPNSLGLSNYISRDGWVCVGYGNEDGMETATSKVQALLNADGVDNYDVQYYGNCNLLFSTYYLPKNEYDADELTSMLDQFFTLEKKIMDMFNELLGIENVDEMSDEDGRLVEDNEFEELLESFSDDEDLRGNLKVYRNKLSWPDKMKCRKCGGDILKMYVRSPKWTWEELCGREGYLYICPYCKEQDHFDCTVMN